MSDIIQLLPDSVANQIAAGEVIQRPASVIKELVENSIDAGANKIDVIIVDAGRTEIQVIDNGKGMSVTDARLSFERHATSKIRKADDLFALHTMGFRGEALASIAAVSQVELKTRHEADEIGIKLNIDGSKFIGQEPCACPVGSNFMIRNLFYNVPARRRFLKSNATEFNNILSAFERIALVYPHIAFTLYNDGKEFLKLPIASFRQRIVDVFGRKMNPVLLPIEANTTLCGIEGYVGKPESARKKGLHQFFFVNGRYMKHPYFHKAVQTAFERLIPLGEQVPYFIQLTVPPEDIDVNIHPTKTEIKFENEQAIWQILLASVRGAIGAFNDVPSIDFDAESKIEIPVYNPEKKDVVAPKVSYDPQYNPFNDGRPQKKPAPIKDWDVLYENLNGHKKSVDMPSIFPSEEEQNDDKAQSLLSDKSPAHYQYKGKYIITAVKSGLLIIDQHRAHVRVLYEDYLRQLSEKNNASQKMLFPEVLHFSALESMWLEKVMPDMIKMGFEISSLGKDSYALNAVPTDIAGLNAEEVIRDMLVSVMENKADIGEEKNKALAVSLSRNVAIPYGQVLSDEVMENLINTLFACENVNYTPDGKKILHILEQSVIEQLFK